MQSFVPTCFSLSIRLWRFKHIVVCISDLHIFYYTHSMDVLQCLSITCWWTLGFFHVLATIIKLLGGYRNTFLCGHMILLGEYLGVECLYLMYVEFRKILPNC